MLADEFAQTIAERRSVGPKQQTHNAPSDDVFVRAARAARSAPSHNPFFPCRFVKVVSRENSPTFSNRRCPQKPIKCFATEPAARRSRVPPASSSSVRNPRPIRLSLWTWKSDDRGRRFDQLPQRSLG